MAGEIQEALQLVIMLSNFALPVGARLVGYSLDALRKGLGIAGNFAVSAAGLGVGIVNNDRYFNGPLSMEDITSRQLQRDDLNKLDKLCKEFGIGVRFIRDVDTGFVGIKYEARNRELLLVALEAIERRMLNQEESIALDEKEFVPTYTVGETFEKAGLSWKCTEDKTYVAKFETSNGKPYIARIAGDGSYAIQDETGNIAKFAGLELKGSIKSDKADINTAACLASAQASVFQDKCIYEHYKNVVEKSLKRNPNVGADKLQQVFNDAANMANKKRNSQNETHQQARKAPGVHV